MERLAVVPTAIVCLYITITGAHGSPFFFPEPDCYQPTAAPYAGGYSDYHGPDYQQTVQEILRALQEIVYLTVRAAKEELSQLASLWFPPCDSGDYPGDSGGVTQGEVSEGAWDQGQSSVAQSEQNTLVGEISTLDTKVGNENTSSSSSSSESSTNGTRKIITTQNITVITHEQTVGSSSSSTSKDIVPNTTSPLSGTDKKQTSEYVIEETITENVTIPNETIE